MQQCKLCYRTHEETVEICDCGGALVRQTVPWLRRAVRRYCSPACPHCGRPMQEELTAENDGFGRVTATMRCATCQQWHEVQRSGPPYILLMLLGVIFIFFLLQASETTLLAEFILGVINLILALQRWLWPSTEQTQPVLTPDAATPPLEPVKNFAAWLDDVAWRPGDQAGHADNDVTQRRTFR